MIKIISVAAVLIAPLVYFIFANHGPVGSIPTEPATIATALPLKSTLAEGGDTEIVLGMPVLKDRNCRVELKDYVTTYGEMFSAYSCTPNTPTSAHIYADYDNVTLANMAYSDADAAALLGRRYVGKDTGKSYELLIRGGRQRRASCLAG